MTPPEVTAADRRCRDHRPGLGREWCYDDGEWCYKDQPCRGCTIVVLQDRVTALEADLFAARQAVLTEGLRVLALEAALAKHCLPQGWYHAPGAGGTA